MPNLMQAALDCSRNNFVEKELLITFGKLNLTKKLKTQHNLSVLFLAIF